MEWKHKFDKDRAARLAIEDEEKTKAMTPKEKEEFRKMKSKLTGTSVPSWPKRKTCR